MYKFRIRCSAIGKIMGGHIGLSDTEQKTLNDLIDRQKPYTDNMEKKYSELLYKRDNPELPQGAKTVCQNWLKGQIYGKKPAQINSKYTQKGHMVEDQAITLIGHKLGLPLTKNEEYRENDFLTGTCDVHAPECIIDNKSSWSWETFPLTAEEIPEKDYYYQGQGYMELWNKKHFKLVYTLMTTPPDLVKRDAKQEWYRVGGDYDDVYDYLMEYHNYDDYALERRYKEFNIEKDEDVIAKIKQRVKMCQVYIDSLVKKLKIGEF